MVSEHKVGGLTAHSVRLSPTVDLTYAIEGSTLVVATDPAAVKQLASGEGGLDGEELFDRATDGFPGEVSMLGYLNLGGLIALGESAGLGEDPAYVSFASEIHKLRALGLAIQSSPEELSTDARLIVGGGGGATKGSGPGGRGADRVARNRSRPSLQSRARFDDDREPLRGRVPVHLRVGHRGPPGQDLRPDLRRRPRRGAGRRPAGAGRLRVPGQHRPGGGGRRDQHRDLRRHPAHRPRHPAADRLRPRQVRVRRRDLLGDHGDRRAIARHRPGRRTPRTRRAPIPTTRTSWIGSAPATRE